MKKKKQPRNKTILLTNNEISEREIKETVPFTTSSNEKKKKTT